MNKDLIWLRCSIFSAKENWGLMLKQIQNFICINYPSKIQRYRLEMNYNSGENIRVAMLCAEANKIFIAKEFDEFFTTFFSTASLPHKEQRWPVDGVFMPFPKNSIQYGLFEVTEPNIQWSKISTALSQTMMEVLCNERIEEETILTFAFYLNICLIRVFKDYCKETGRIISLNFEYNYNYSIVPNHVDRAIQLQKYNEGKASMIEIYNEIMFEDNKLENSNWISTWMEACQNEIRRLSGISMEKETLLHQHLMLINIINGHLSLSPNLKAMLYFFITQIQLDS